MHGKGPLIPGRLKKGGCIGLFSPAGPVRDREKVHAGVHLLHELGFRTKQLNLSAPAQDYLAADDRTRIDEFHALWADEETDALMAVRGGYGCLRILKDIRLDLVRHRPKILIGFSDVTALLNLVSEQGGLVAVHGPVVSSLADGDPDSIRALAALLSGGLAEYNLRGRIEILRAGKASGTLKGGNLTTLIHLLGTPWEISFANALLVLEDTGEQMYKIDRMLTQLYYGGKLDNLAGIILGSFDHGLDAVERLRLEERIWHRVLEITDEFGYPVWGNFPVGHRHPNYPLLIGASATMDSGSGRLLFHDMLK
ncbi:MAG: LD-carboxypeptidase [Desulfobulbaceae bacterium]|jgi:muramoyltetrapeptide carboxypeptidase|nr:LD-carboxypeptidase [Desulfobulbaceae bacterium]MDY0350529.1 LD-carboxypeptidase [Desulfobulbaceae bacterium]